MPMNQPNQPPTASNPTSSSDGSAHRRVVRALARQPITGVLLLDYGLRYAFTSMRAGARVALTLAAGALITFCVVVAAPQTVPPCAGDLQGGGS